MSSTTDAAPDALTPVREADYLEQDPPIRGQRYACVSFVSPSDALLASKNAFCARRFLATVAKDVAETLDNVSKVAPDTARMLRERHAYLWDEKAAQQEYALFMSQGAEEIERAFRDEHDGPLVGTSIHGFKIRGSYDTVEDAKARAKSVKRFDEKFSVFVAEVGCWCPWSPSVEELKDVEYAETQLNTLMKKYSEGNDARDEVYNTRKDESVKRMADEREVWIERIRAETAAREKADAELVVRVEVVDAIPDEAGDAPAPDEVPVAAEEVTEEVTAAAEVSAAEVSAAEV